MHDVDAIAAFAQRIEERLAAHLEEFTANSAWPRWMDLGTAAKYSSISERSLKRMIVAGDLRACHPRRGCTVLDRLEIDAAMKASRQGRRLSNPERRN